MHFLPARLPEIRFQPARSPEDHIPLVFLTVDSQSPSNIDDVPSQNAGSDSTISLPLLVGILSFMFLIFMLLLYCKFCRRRPGVVQSNIPLIPSTSASSGIDKTVIYSLPFFKFSWLKGFCEGLECTVCLSKFKDVEVLRLLPCKHAFHIDCADKWLERHSTCPLCRQMVNTEDTIFSANSSSLRFLQSHSELREDSILELLIQNEEENGGSPLFCCGCSFSKILKGKKEEEMPTKESTNSNEHSDEDISFSKIESQDSLSLGTIKQCEFHAVKFKNACSMKFPSVHSLLWVQIMKNMQRVKRLRMLKWWNLRSIGGDRVF